MVGQPPWGDQSSKSLARTLTPGTRLELIDFGKDKYGRTLGHLIENGRNVNVEQVRKGQAVSYIICESGKCTEQALQEIRYHELQDACQRAEKAGLGIFDPTQPLRELPFEFRLRMQNRKPDKFVGNLVTREYVPPARYREIPVCDRIFFMAEKDAKALGYQRVP
jgi:endonuclease YncB( thermonuclease family)